MLTDLAAYRALATHRAGMENTTIAALYAADPTRTNRFEISLPGIAFNYASHRADDETMKLLIDLAQGCALESWREKMFTGAPINNTERRAVLHTALRAPANMTVMADGENVMPFIHDTLERMRIFSDAVRNGSWKGFTGKKIERIVNLGIGGSDLGPRLVCEALRGQATGGPHVDFVANIDPAALDAALHDANPQTTLFVIASKSFTTQETMANAAAAKTWLLAALHEPAAIGRHFAALSTNEAAVRDFGIDPTNMFAFRDWVGGRFSVWSAIGLPVCLRAGFKAFRDLLDGAFAMDTHFRTAPLAANMPVVLAMLGIWYRNFWGAGALAVLPYAQDLARLPDWLQQLDMESNGKRVDRDGRAVTYPTGPVVFGQPGTNGQHAFHQLLHQGSETIPCEFVTIANPAAADDDRHNILLAHAAAQAQALWQGRSLAEAGGDPQRVFPGSRPSGTITLERLDPYHLGMLLALYEHKIFVQGIIWNLNSFDQWGVELGKELAAAILQRRRDI